MIIPVYQSKVSRKPLKCDAGPLIKCPACRRTLMAAIIEKLHVRCKRCGMWVYFEKMS